MNVGDGYRFGSELEIMRCYWSDRFMKSLYDSISISILESNEYEQLG